VDVLVGYTRNLRITIWKRLQKSLSNKGINSFDHKILCTWFPHQNSGKWTNHYDIFPYNSPDIQLSGK
ncbi:MAG: hypothetical protein ACLP5V_04850, partial [Candidatus Bathyarchaeia archaeon]